MSEARDRWIDESMGRMNLKEKVGQLMVYSFAGPIITPDIVDLIRKGQLGGLRINLKFRTTNLLNDVKPGTQPHANIMRSWVAPSGSNRDYTTFNQCTSASPGEYTEVLNQLRKIAMERPSGIPIHCAYDQEGNGADDLINGVRLYPSPMGLAASGDPDLAYRVALASGRQAKAMGGNMIHSPVIDVNTNPRNPEIGPRAYSDDPETVMRFALASLKGYQDAGIMATGKHFPGRGESEADAHWGLPVVKLSREELLQKHIAPYKKLFDAGLPCIMTAHTVFPALGDEKLAATLSPSILTDFLRGELGFQGVVTTDNMMMGGILMDYEMTEAIVMALQAGCDLILCRDESPARWRILEAVVEAAKKGTLSEKRLDESVQRVLRLRWDMGLVENGGIMDPYAADAAIRNPDHIALDAEAAEKSVLLLRDEAGTLPLKSESKVLLLEQIFLTQGMANNMYCHPGMLWEAMSRLSDRVGCVELFGAPEERDEGRIMDRLDEADVVVATSYYYHKSPGTMAELLRKVRAKGKPVILVTNNPYDRAAPPEFETVITGFAPASPENMRVVAEILYGKRRASAKLPIRL